MFRILYYAGTHPANERRDHAPTTGRLGALCPLHVEGFQPCFSPFFHRRPVPPSLGHLLLIDTTLATNQQRAAPTEAAQRMKRLFVVSICSHKRKPLRRLDKQSPVAYTKSPSEIIALDENPPEPRPGLFAQRPNALLWNASLQKEGSREGMDERHMT